jgi:uncharacterized protein YeaO (DUF488 family)
VVRSRPEGWPEFRRRYEVELQSPEKAQHLRDVADKARQGTVTLVFATRNMQHNNAIVLKELLERAYLRQ